MDVKLEFFKKHDDKDFRLVQIFTTVEAGLKHFIRLRTQLDVAAETFRRGKKLFPVPFPTVSKNMEEQFKQDQKAVDVVVRANKHICVTLLRYNVEKPGSSYAQVQFFAKNNGDEQFPKKKQLG